MNTPDVSERLEEIAMHLRHLDRRDRMRMVGGTIRSILHLAMLIFVVGSSWYLLANMDEIIKLMAQEAAKQSQVVIQGGSEDMMQRLQQMLGR